jgi:sporulation protein YlmC with PRC-barrel domain
MLIDGDKRQVEAFEIGNGFLSHPHYLPFGSIKSIENDVLTLTPSGALVAPRDFNTFKLVGNLSGRQVVTEDGKHLGTVHEYDVDTKNGEINFITVAMDTAMLGGLWQSAGERFDIPRNLITALGDSVIVTAQFHTKYSSHASE